MTQGMPTWGEPNAFLTRLVGMALTEAALMHHDYLGEEHVMMALTRHPGGFTERMLQRLHLEPAMARSTLRATLPLMFADGPTAQVVFTPRLTQTLQRALGSAANESMGEQQILLAILASEPAPVTALLMRDGMTMDMIADGVRADTGSEASAPPRGSALRSYEELYAEAASRTLLGALGPETGSLPAMDAVEAVSPESLARAHQFFGACLTRGAEESGSTPRAARLAASGAEALARTINWVSQTRWRLVARFDLFCGLALTTDCMAQRALQANAISVDAVLWLNLRLFGYGRDAGATPVASRGVAETVRRAAQIATDNGRSEVTADDIAVALLDQTPRGSMARMFKELKIAPQQLLRFILPTLPDATPAPLLATASDITVNGPRWHRRGAADISFSVDDRLTDFSTIDLTVARKASGGFSTVYMGPDEITGRWLALKMIRSELIGRANVGAQARLHALFLREALVWLGLWPHPNLVTAQSVTLVTGRETLVLSYAEHGSLRDLYEQYKQSGRWFTLSDALRIAQQIATGLLELHTPALEYLRYEPLVHRDIKPENVLFDQSGSAGITDFGLAKTVAGALAVEAEYLTDLTPTSARDGETHTHKTQPGIAGLELTPGSFTQDDVTRVDVTRVDVTRVDATVADATQVGVAMGTPAYMAPEQWLDARDVTPAADMYSFGVVMAELLTGQHPLLDLGRPHQLDEWRNAHMSLQPIPLHTLGAEVFNTRRALTSVAELAARDAAFVRLDDLVSFLLSKNAEYRPTAAETLEALRSAAISLGDEPYTPPVIYAHTDVHEMVFWQNWADAFGRFDLYEEALSRLDRASHFGPDDPGVLCSRASALVELKRHEEALPLFHKALAVTPPGNITGRKIILNQLGNALSDLERYKEAEDCYAEEVALMPLAADAWGNRAINEGMWAQETARTGQLDEAQSHVAAAIQYAEHAVSLSPVEERARRLVKALRSLSARL